MRPLLHVELGGPRSTLWSKTGLSANPKGNPGCYKSATCAPGFSRKPLFTRRLRPSPSNPSWVQRKVYTIDVPLCFLHAQLFFRPRPVRTTADNALARDLAKARAGSPPIALPTAALQAAWSRSGRPQGAPRQRDPSQARPRRATARARGEPDRQGRSYTGAENRNQELCRPHRAAYRQLSRDRQAPRPLKADQSPRTRRATRTGSDRPGGDVTRAGVPHPSRPPRPGRPSSRPPARRRSGRAVPQ